MVSKSVGGDAHGSVAEQIIKPTGPVAPGQQNQNQQTSHMQRGQTANSAAQPVDDRKADNLASKLANKPNLKADNLGQEVARTASSVGTQKKDIPHMIGAVYDRLAAMGAIKEDGSFDDAMIDEEMLTKPERNELRRLRKIPSDQRSREIVAKLALLGRKDTPPSRITKKK